MLRMLLTLCAVATLSYAASNMEYAGADRPTLPNWVRTVDGWEPASVLSTELDHATLPTLHPFLVAGFELGASVFVLLAFPGNATKGAGEKR